MKNNAWKLILAVGLFAPTLNAHAGVTDEALARFVGTWNMNLVAHEESFGEQGGAGTGTMVCAWGLMQAWVDCQMDSTYESFGAYGLKIVLYRLASDGEVGAFVTNNWGGGRLYEGAFNAGGQLVFADAWVDPDRNWEHQRTVYGFDGENKITFELDVSSDGVQYLPHSSGVYSRQ